MTDAYNKKIDMKNSSGIALVESVVAMSVLLIGLVGVMVLVNNALATNEHISRQYEATYLAAEGIEIVKNLIDANMIQGNPWLENLTGGSPGKVVDFGSQHGLGCSGAGWPKNVCTYSGGRNLFFETDGRYYYYSTGPSAQAPVHKYSRRIEIVQVAADEVEVLSRISWTDRNGSVQQVDLYDYFFNWR